MFSVLSDLDWVASSVRVGRRLNSSDVIETLAELMLECGTPAHIRSDNRPEFVARAVPPVDRRCWRQHRLHRAGLTVGERICRELQLQAHG